MIEHLSVHEWIAFDCAYPAPTGFARPYWSLALAQAYPHLKPDPVRISTARGKPVIVALMRETGGIIPWRVWHGSFFGGYTCFLHEDGTYASGDETIAAIEELGRTCDACTITPWPLALGPETLRFPVNGKSLRLTSHEAAVIDLRGGIEKAGAELMSTYRRMARQAANRGVTCSVEHGSRAAREYYRMLEESAIRWGIGTPTIPLRLHEACVRFGGDDVELWFARAPGTSQPIGGCVAFYGSQEVFGWTLAMRMEHSRLRPSNAIFVALLNAAFERGLNWLNLGSSEGLPGVAHFKRNLGARNNPYVTASHERASFRAWKRMRSLMTVSGSRC